MSLRPTSFRSVVGLIVISLFGTTAAFSQAAQSGQKTLLAEEAFKNVQVFRGIPAKEFMETMGFFAASLSLTCSDCHSEASGANWNNYADETPIKQTTRRMVVMVDAINKANFGGKRGVTCYTCHRGTTRPKVIPSLAAQYAAPADDDPDEVEILPGTKVTTTPEQILDRYIKAVGGQDVAAKLNSFIAKGTYSGFDSDFEEVKVDIYAKAPNKRAMAVHMSAGDNTSTYDGNSAWSAGPDTLVPIPVIELVGQNRLGAHLDAQLAFPSLVKGSLTGWRAGFPATEIDGKPVDIIEGKMADGTPAKLYFDKATGLLVRQARMSETMIGTVRTHVIYSDYRAVPGVGVKIPFHTQITWTDGQADIHLTSVQPNVAIEDARFAKPAPPPPAGGRK